VVRDIYTSYTGHDVLSFLLTLALFMTRIFTDHAQNALASHQLAVATDFFDRCLNAHFLAPS
jgi:hypothetical protein